MMINSEQQKSEEEIIKNGEFCDDKNDNEKKKLLFKLINEIIIGNFSSFEEIKEDFILINTKYFKIKQYYTYNQNIGSLCGFHSLFNIYYFLLYLTSKEENQKKCVLFNLRNAWSFWSFYKESVNYLLTNLKLEPKAEQSLKSCGPLERYQFIYLLEEFPKIKTLFEKIKINYDISYTKFLFGFGIFNGTIEEGIDFQKKIDSFLDNKNDASNKEKILIILLGIVNHWNTLILYKNKENNIEIYLLDSRNSPDIFNFIELYDDEKINNKNNKEIIEKIKEEYINDLLKKKYKNKNISKWFITFRKDWYDSMNKSIILISKILSKKANLINYIIKNKINILLDSFTSKTNFDLINFDPEIKFNKINNINKEQILKWIKEDYHPSVFKDELLYDIKKANFIIKNIKFISWSKLMKIYINEEKDNKSLNDNDKDIIRRYMNYLNELDKYFCNMS